MADTDASFTTVNENAKRLTQKGSKRDALKVYYWVTRHSVDIILIICKIYCVI